MMGEIEQWYHLDDERERDYILDDGQTFLGELADAAFGDVASDISTVVGSLTQGASNVVTSIGDAKAGGGLSKTIGDTAVKIGLGVGLALAAYAIMKR